MFIFPFGIQQLSNLHQVQRSRSLSLQTNTKNLGIPVILNIALKLRHVIWATNCNNHVTFTGCARSVFRQLITGNQSNFHPGYMQAKI